MYYDITTDYMRFCDYSGRNVKYIPNPNEHPMPRPRGRTMVCHLLDVWRKLTALCRHRIALVNGS